MVSEKYMINKRSVFIPKNEIFRDYREVTSWESTPSNFLFKCDYDDVVEEENDVPFFRR